MYILNNMRSGKKHFYLRKKYKNNKKTHKKHYRKQKGGEPWTNPAKGPSGFAWEADKIVSWPGVYAANGGKNNGEMWSNYYPLSKTGINVGGFDPLPLKENNFPYNPPEHYTERGYKNISLKGGRARKSNKKYFKKINVKKSKKRMNGGFFGLGQNIINLGRDMKFRANSFYNDLMGTKPPIDPSPLEQPINQDLKILNIKPINLPQAYREAGNKVVAI